MSTAKVLAGIPSQNRTLYHRLRFSVGDPAALIDFVDTDPRGSLFIVRDIEMDRARQHARADEVACPADFAPEGGLSGDRETATAQALAECLVRHGIQSVIADRTLPLIFADEIQTRGIRLSCDRDWGVIERRHKDDEEVAHLRRAQQITEQAVELACRMIGTATAKPDGTLEVAGQPLTSQRVRAAADTFLLEQGFAGSRWIIAGGTEGSDCHNLGQGTLRTGQPIIVDIFPQDRQSKYHGDCTRTVVHGEVPSPVQNMHAAIVAAKAAGIAACRAGVTGEQVHQATIDVIRQHGFEVGLPAADAPDDYCAMVHGTGHGIGLDVHEPPLLDFGGPALVPGDAITVEPGLYCKSIGGIRVEDMVIVTESGCENLNRLPEGLTWE